MKSHDAIYAMNHDNRDETCTSPTHEKELSILYEACHWRYRQVVMERKQTAPQTESNSISKDDGNNDDNAHIHPVQASNNKIGDWILAQTDLIGAVQVACTPSTGTDRCHGVDRTNASSSSNNTSRLGDGKECTRKEPMTRTTWLQETVLHLDTDQELVECDARSVRALEALLPKLEITAADNYWSDVEVDLDTFFELYPGCQRTEAGDDTATDIDDDDAGSGSSTAVVGKRSHPKNTSTGSCPIEKQPMMIITNHANGDSVTPSTTMDRTNTVSGIVTAVHNPYVGKSQPPPVLTNNTGTRTPMATTTNGGRSTGLANPSASIQYPIIPEGQQWGKTGVATHHTAVALTTNSMQSLWEDPMLQGNSCHQPQQPQQQNPFQSAREWSQSDTWSSGKVETNNTQPVQTWQTVTTGSCPPIRECNPYLSTSSSHSIHQPPLAVEQPPVIRESLKRKFQPPIKHKTSEPESAPIRPRKNGLATCPPSSMYTAKQQSQSSRYTTESQKRGDSRSINDNEEDGNELPEQLQRFGKELVEKIESEIMDCGEPVTFQDIAGLADAKQTVQEVVCWPMKRPDLFTGLRRAPNGLLLYGPPGTGKTLIGKAIAHESGATFFSISSSSLTSKWIGEGEKLVRTLFAVAAYREPAVVFIDEIDSLLTQRKADENEASRRIKTEFLVQLDGTGTSVQGRVLVIGATNRPQELDEAARRRFTKRLYIPLPTEEDREILLRVLLSKNNHRLDDTEIKSLAKDTVGFSGADLKALSTDAAMGPIRQLGAKALDVAVSDVPPISFKHFKQALRGMKPSVAQSDLKQYEEWDTTYGSKRFQIDEDGEGSSNGED